MQVQELLLRQKENDKVAIIKGNNSITYKQWYEKSANVKERIMETLAEDSRNVVLFLPNSIEYAISYMGSLLSGRVVVPVGTQAKSPELFATLTYCECDLLITDSQWVDGLVEQFANYTYKIHILDITTMKVITLHEEKEYIAKSTSNEQEDVAIMLHTSGTLSNPKRVMLTHSNLIFNIESNIASLGYTSEDISLIALPMYFGYCNTAQFLTHVYLGATIIIMDSIFFPKTFFQLVSEYGVTNFTGVPSMLLMLLKFRYADKYDIKSLRYICFGGGTMPVGGLKELIERFHTVGFVQTYGQTECSPRVTALMPEHAMDKIGSVGKCIPGVRAEIMDESGKILNCCETGEIVVQGKNVMKGYYKRPELTKEVIQNGWLHTGDIGYYDEDGFLYLKGRKKNMIISGGINIYPEEVEQIIRDYGGIQDVCVAGENDYMLGEVPVARLVAENVDLDKLKSYCQENMANYKVPVRFYLVEELKKTYNGKVKRGGSANEC